MSSSEENAYLCANRIASACSQHVISAPKVSTKTRPPKNVTVSIRLISVFVYFFVLECPEGCLSCDSAINCRAWQTSNGDLFCGYNVTTQEFTGCYSCLPNGDCDICEDGYIRAGNRCIKRENAPVVPCDENCLCTSNYSSCDYCKVNFFDDGQSCQGEQ
jgi:hypothetical protein